MQQHSQSLPSLDSRHHPSVPNLNILILPYFMNHISAYDISEVSGAVLAASNARRAWALPDFLFGKLCANMSKKISNCHYIQEHHQIGSAVDVCAWRTNY